MKIKNLFLILLISSVFIACGSPDKQLLKGIEENNIKSVQKALNKGADIEKTNSEGYTPLMISIMKNADAEIIKLLLEKGANPNTKMTVKEDKGEREVTPLSYVTDSGNIELTKLLLDHSGDPNIKLSSDSILTRVVGKCARTGNKNYLTIAKILLEKGADPNTKSGKDSFCPMLAAMTANTEAETFELLQLLLSYGADPNVEFSGISPLDGAIEQNYISVMKLLLDNKANINIKTHLSHPELGGKGVKNLSSLGVAITSGNLYAVKLLLQNGADINIASTMYNDNTNFRATMSALSLAIPYENKDIIRLLLNYGANANDIVINGQNKLSLVSFALGTKDLEKVKMLIDNGAIINQEFVMIAMTLGSKNIIDFLMSLDKKKIIKNTETLFNAINSGDIQLAENAIKNVAFINSTDTNGNTPLINAVSSKNKEIIKLLLDNGANTNIKNKQGHTALILAVRNGDTDIVNLLLDHCADVNIKIKTGITPLMVASYYGNIDIIKLLLNNGADMNIVANNGDTALSVAQSKGHKDIVDLFKLREKFKNSSLNILLQQMITSANKFQEYQSGKNKGNNSNI